MSKHGPGTGWRETVKAGTRKSAARGGARERGSWRPGVLNAQRPVGYETPLAAGSSAGARNQLDGTFLCHRQSVLTARTTIQLTPSVRPLLLRSSRPCSPIYPLALALPIGRVCPRVSWNFGCVVHACVPGIRGRTPWRTGHT